MTYSLVQLNWAWLGDGQKKKIKKKIKSFILFHIIHYNPHRRQTIMRRCYCCYAYLILVVRRRRYFDNKEVIRDMILQRGLQMLS